MPLTQERLKELLRYDPLTGVFLWRVNRGPARAGKRAGCVAPAGYRAIRPDGKMYLEHRLAWLYMTGSWPDNEVDHRDLDKSNNAWSNLRPATSSQNKANRKAQGKYPKGVTFHRPSGLFRAEAQRNGSRFYLGYFRTAELAHAAYCAAAPKIHGEFARAA
jgi:hypothetical protein